MEKILHPSCTATFNKGPRVTISPKYLLLSLFFSGFLLSESLREKTVAWTEAYFSIFLVSDSTCQSSLGLCFFDLVCDLELLCYDLPYTATVCCLRPAVLTESVAFPPLFTHNTSSHKAAVLQRSPKSGK